MQKKQNPATTTTPSRRAILHAARSGPIQLRPPRFSPESFRRKCEEESLSLANDPQEVEVLHWIAKVSDSDVS
jgi:hypothetical protein